jgi:hypothetical protein
MRMQKVFRFGPRRLVLTVTMPKGSVVASMDEDDEMLKVMKKVTNDAELASAVVVPSHSGGCVCVTHF